MARKFDIQYVHFQTDGNAARQVARVEPLHTVKLPKARKKKLIVIPVDPVATAGIFMAAIMFVMLTVGLVQLQDSRQDVKVMASYVETLREENAFLADTYESGYDIAQVEQTALALGLVPQEQVKKVVMRVPQPVEETPNAWQQFYTFLTGLFA